MILLRSLLGRRVCACLSLLVSSLSILRAVPAFPGAEGFGANAVGGRGGEVYIVSNLNDSGPGSFRDAVSQPNRTVVFAVGGIIPISSRIIVAANTTIAGQTAPGEGITIYGNGLSFSNANNSITRYLRIRMGVGGDSGKDAVTIAEGHDLMFDHVTVSWGRDETFSISGDVRNVTIQDSMIAQGLQTHSAGGLIQTDGGVSILRTLYIDNHTRNPKVKGVNDFVNNVIYNWGGGGGYILGDSAGPSYANIVNNLFINGPQTSVSAFSRGNLNFHVYASKNYQDGNRNGVLDPQLIPESGYTTVDFQPARYPYPEVSYLLEPADTFDYVAQHAGASLARDRVDRLLIETLRSLGTAGEIIANENEAPISGPGPVAGGVAPADRDRDGMPDAWETSLGLNPDLADHNGDSDGDGYTNLENYLNALAAGGIQRVFVLRVSPDSGASDADAVTSSGQLHLHGRAAPGSQVTVRRVGAGIAGTATAGTDGLWSLDFTATTLPDGLHAFSASATEPSGWTTPPSKALFVTVDRTAPESAAITSVSQTTALQIRGTAEPGAHVNVLLENTGSLGATQADAVGLWTLNSEHPALPGGVFHFSVTSTDRAGNAGAASAPYVLDAALPPPSIAGITDDAGVSPSDFITRDSTLLLRGQAAAGATVQLAQIGRGVLGTAVAAADGTWSYDHSATPLEPGTHSFSATLRTDTAASLASTPIAVRIDAQAPAVSNILRHDPLSSATVAGNVVYRATFSEDVAGVDISDFSLTASGTSAQLGAVSTVSPSVYDISVTGLAGEGTVRLDLRASATGITDVAGNAIGSGFTAGQSYTVRLPGSGVWTSSDSGLWASTENWENGVVASGAGATADFSAVELEEDVVVDLGGARVLGHVVFGDLDTTTPGGWRLTGAEGLTLDSATTAPSITVNPLATGSAAAIGVPLSSTTGLAKLGTGAVQLERINDVEGPLTLSRGVLRLVEGSSLEVSAVSIGNAGTQLQINGGSFRASELTTITSGGSSGIQVNAGTADFAGGILSTNARDALVNVKGGLLTTPRIEFPRTNDGSINFRVGLVVQGGEARVGSIGLGTGNSWGTMSIEGGTLQVQGAVIVGQQATAGRGGRMRVTGGVFNVVDAVEGLVLARNPGTQPNNVASAEFTGGVSTLGKVTLGYDATSTAGSATFTLNGGTVYLGSGGLVANGTLNFAANVVLARGVLGAAADWSTAVALQLPADNDVSIHTADAAGVARVVSLLGELKGSGGLRKTGAGTLLLSGENNFTGALVLEEGTLRSRGPRATAGALTLQGGTSLAFDLGPDGQSDRLVVGGALLSGDGGKVTVTLTSTQAASLGQTYTLATFSETNFSAGDFIAQGLPPGMAALFAMNGTSLTMTLVGPPVISSSASATGKVGDAFSYQISATNGPETYSAQGLPEGLQLNAATGAISGTPLAAGTFAVNLGATNAAGAATAVLALDIAKADATVTLSQLHPAYDGTPKPVRVTTVPSDLAVAVTYDGQDAAPTWPGTYLVRATVEDSDFAGEATATLTLLPTALVRHAPTLNGDIEGSVQVLLAENTTLNGGAGISGDLLMRGTPKLRLNGQPVYAGERTGAGASAPTNHVVTLSGGTLLRHLVRRIDPITMPVVAAPDAPAGSRRVTLNVPSDSAGDFATLRDLTLNSGVGTVLVPPGAYGEFRANTGSGFEFGVAGAAEPAVYHLQRLTLNSGTELRIVGPVILRLGNSVTISGNAGSAQNPRWLKVEIARGGLTLNDSAAVKAEVLAPLGSVTLNSGTKLDGRVSADRLTLNSGALLRQAEL